jgi:pyruvate dehydrogenase E2 component (dihydrolipoamide acetyltransferase)
MPINVIMPQMGEAILEGTVTKWLKKVGDRVKQEESLFEVSTDKVDTEIPSPAEGVLTRILVKEGETVQVNTVVAVLEAEAAVERSGIPEAAAPPEVGAVSEIQVIPMDAVVPDAEIVAEPAEAVKSDTATEVPAEESAFVRTSPLVRRIARDHGVDLSKICGTGLSGRIRKEDILGHLEGKKGAGDAPKAAPPPAATLVEEPVDAPVSMTPARDETQIVQRPEPIVVAVEAEQEKKPSQPAQPVELPRFQEDSETMTMSPMRKAIAEHMVLSKRTSAHVQTVFEVDMTAILQLRQKHADKFEARTGISLTYTPFFVKALIETVRGFPILNSSVSGDKIILKKSVNIGIAVALDTGLIVPVVMDAHLKSFPELALAIHDLAKRARTKKLRPEEVQHGTITVTNPGIFGSLFGMPIINQPQVAILCVGSLEKRPVIINDAIAIRTMVYLVLSFDHRIIDGAVADQSMAALKSKLQSWNTWRD